MYLLTVLEDEHPRSGCQGQALVRTLFLATVSFSLCLSHGRESEKFLSFSSNKAIALLGIGGKRLRREDVVLPEDAVL